MLEILTTEGVRHVFGNPGTTEMPLIDALSRQTDIKYVLSLQESSVIGMADGYAQITGRPSFANVHAAGGLGNAMGNITNARANHTALVITAGQQDLRHLASEPLLAGDLVSMPKAWVKSSQEAHSTSELGTLMRRAFKDAGTTPKGPVFLSMPMNLLDEECELRPPARSHLSNAESTGDVTELVKRLQATAPGRLAFVMGDEALAPGCGDLVRLATALGATVYGAPMHGRFLFPTDHALWAGALPFSSDKIRDTLAHFERIVFFGDQAFLVYLYTDASPVPEGVDFIHVSGDPNQLGRAHATSLGLAAHPPAVIRQLADIIERDASLLARENAHKWLVDAQKGKLARDAGQERRVTERSGRAPMDPMSAVHAVMSSLPADVLVVEEAITASAYVRGFYRGAPHAFLACRGGGLGWGMPAAIGASLGAGSTPTVCIVGDGSAMYSPQALWSAANLNVPVVFVVINNSEYRILKQYGARTYGGAGTGGSVALVGLDLHQPRIDFLALARSMGIQSARASTENETAEAVHSAVHRKAPFLLELVVTP